MTYDLYKGAGGRWSAICLKDLVLGFAGRSEIEDQGVRSEEESRVKGIKRLKCEWGSVVIII